MAFTAVKMVVLAPMPSASVRIAAAVNTGLERKRRSETIRSWQSRPMSLSYAIRWRWFALFAGNKRHGPQMNTDKNAASIRGSIILELAEGFEPPTL